MGTSRHIAYDPFVLSEEERRRFLSALDDGFGNSPRHQNLVEEKLPATIDPGLLEHRAYYDKRGRSEFFDEDEDGEFWEESDDDSPPGLFEQCPLNFHLPAIREYFLEQRAAYLRYAKSLRDYEWMKQTEPENRPKWDDHIYNQVLYQTYSKGWYEYHVNQHIFFVSHTAPMLDRHEQSGTPLGLTTMLLINFSAQLGRLIEQYFWKFVVEKSAIRGAKISESARAGGAVLSRMRKEKHRQWQAVAILIWKERPTISKMGVASILKKRLNVKETAKHISRVIYAP